MYQINAQGECVSCDSAAAEQLLEILDRMTEDGECGETAHTEGCFQTNC
jgi:hypothetical protein